MRVLQRLLSDFVIYISFYNEMNEKKLKWVASSQKLRTISSLFLKLNYFDLQIND